MERLEAFLDKLGADLGWKLFRVYIIVIIAWQNDAWNEIISTFTLAAMVIASQAALWNSHFHSFSGFNDEELDCLNLQSLSNYGFCMIISFLCALLSNFCPVENLFKKKSFSVDSNISLASKYLLLSSTTWIMGLDNSIYIGRWLWLPKRLS